MKLMALLIFRILRHNDVITILYWTYEFRFEIRVSNFKEFQLPILKGLCRENVNIENQRETCLQIGAYVGLIMSFLDSNYTDNTI